MQPFSTIQYKVSGLELEQKKQQTNFENEELKTVKITTQTTLKKIHTFSLVEKRLLGSSTIEGSVYSIRAMFYNLPDWAIPMIKITPIFTTVLGESISLSTTYSNYRYYWEKVSSSTSSGLNSSARGAASADNNYKLYLTFWTSLDSYYGKIFVKINAHFFDLNLYMKR